MEENGLRKQLAVRALESGIEPTDFDEGKLPLFFYLSFAECQLAGVFCVFFLVCLLVFCLSGLSSLHFIPSFIYFSIWIS